MKDTLNDSLEVLAAGSTGLVIMLTDIELVLKCLIGLATLLFIVYKFYKETKK